MPRLQAIADLYRLTKTANSGNLIRAFHCGRDVGTGFDIKFARSGEGMNVLGPGIYFCNLRSAAERYAKYHREPVLYECDIDISNYYEPRAGKPQHLLQSLKEICADLNIEDMNPNGLTYGQGYIGKINAFLGSSKANAILIDSGICGAFEHIGDELLELCAFDLKTVNIAARYDLNRDINMDKVDMDRIVEALDELWISKRLNEDNIRARGLSKDLYPDKSIYELALEGGPGSGMDYVFGLDEEKYLLECAKKNMRSSQL